MKKNNFILAVLMLFCVTVFSQRTYDEVITADGNVKDLVINENTGVVVFKTGGSITGIDADTKKVVWTLKEKVDYASTPLSTALEDANFEKLMADKKELTIIPNSPYLETYANSKLIIINTATGKVVYDASNEEFGIIDTNFLAETDELLFTIKKKDDMNIALIDMSTGKIKWNTTVDKAKSLFAMAFSSYAAFNKSMVNGNTVYFLLYGKLYSLDRESGKLNWKTTEDYNKFFPTQNDKNIVVMNSKGGLSSKQKLNVLNTENGKSIWKDPIVTKYVVYMEDWDTKLLLAHYSGFNFFDLKTGQKIWKKDARGDGLKRVIPINTDFLYVAENEMMLIDKGGNKLWKKFIEIADDVEDPIFYLGKIGEKVMYLTGTYGNMVDYISGTKLWKRNIKFNKNRPVLSTYDETSNSYLVYNDEKLFKFNPTITDKPEPFAEVNIKKEKELNGIEMFPWGVSISGPLEVMGVGLDGTVKYHNIYSQPGEVGRQFIKGTAIAGSVVTGVGSAVSQIEGAEWTMTTRDENGKETTQVVKERDDKKMEQAKNYAKASAAAGMVADKYAKRYNAMKQSNEYSYIFAKSEAGEKMLVKVRKADGVEVDKLIFKDNKPVYEVDHASQNIFYINGKTVEIFAKK